MDIWIVLFIIMSVVVFIVSYLVPQLATGTRKTRKRTKSPLPQNSGSAALRRELYEDDLDEWEVGAPGAIQLDNMSFKGLRIAWKQFNSELEALLKETLSTGRVEPHHTKKLKELETFYNNTLKSHLEVLSEQDQNTIKDKLARAKRLIERY